MKKKIFFLLVLLFSLSVCSVLAQEEARDITSQAKITSSTKGYAAKRAYDRDYMTAFTSENEKHPSLEFKVDEPCYGIYVCFFGKLRPWEIQVQNEGKWETVAQGEGKYAHEYIELSGLTHFRLTYPDDYRRILSVNEVFLFSEGTLPSFVQRWQPSVEKADLMLLVAHPDDEILFFGGTLPTYAGELKKNVIVCYMTCNKPARRSELLNGLWLCGVRTYPEIGNFYDKYSLKLSTIYDAWGKTNTWKHITMLMRKYKPEVVLTHDIGGEYGHGAHRVCANAALKCMDYANDENKYTDSVAEYGVWQPKKLYIHMYKDNQIEMDYDVPLKSQNGKTGFEVAQVAYTLHASQPQGRQFKVEPKGTELSSYLFGLAYTTVGQDVEKKDFFENIPVSSVQ